MSVATFSFGFVYENIDIFLKFPYLELFRLQRQFCRGQFCSDSMTKAILQGTVKGARRRGRQKKRWEDNIKEWTGMEFGDSLRAAENMKMWKDIVATSTVVPRRPPRLRE